MTDSFRNEADGPASCFTVYAGQGAYGLSVTDAQTIFKLGEVTAVPASPDDVAGLTNLRGRVMTVISLQQKLRGGAGRCAAGALAIGLSVDGEDFALVVDRVGEVIATGSRERLSVPQHLDADLARLTDGLYRVGEDLLPVLNVRELVARSPRQTGESPAQETGRRA